MLEFRRFLSYIYSYRDSVKQKNTGFAKVEARGEVLRVQVHIKGMYPIGTETCQVYGFYRQNQKMYGILLGEFCLRNGSGDMAAAEERNHIAGTDISLEQLGGIYIVMKNTPDVIMASAWDNDPVEPWNFVIYQQKIEENPKEKKNLQGKNIGDGRPGTKENIDSKREDIAGKEESNPESKREEDIIGKEEGNPESKGAENVVSKEESNPESKREEDINGKIEENTEEISTNALQSEEIHSNNVPFRSVGKKDIPGTVEEESKATEDFVFSSDSAKSAELKCAQEENREVREQSVMCGEVIPFVDKYQKSEKHCGQKILWHKIMRKYPVVHPFEHRQELELVRIEPKDISLLTKPYWALGNNSFLLHGYCSYRYLILGRTPENNSFFLGVPGIFHPREKLLANMFGFSEFYTSRNVRVYQGEFGYYVRSVELLEEDCSPRM